MYSACGEMTTVYYFFFVCLRNNKIFILNYNNVWYKYKTEYTAKLKALMVENYNVKNFKKYLQFKKKISCAQNFKVYSSLFSKNL